MKKRENNSSKAGSGKATQYFPGYPMYPSNEDIYNRNQKEIVDPNDILQSRRPITKSKYNEKDFEEDVSGEDLDIPGAELDDAQEDIGSEDEENNYYSLGGDNHNDLEENTGRD